LLVKFEIWKRGKGGFGAHSSSQIPLQSFNGKRAAIPYAGYERKGRITALIRWLGNKKGLFFSFEEKHRV
jgi:hypothetical protein